MSRFNIEKFKKALQQFKELKAKPYNREEWKVNSSLADRCSKILESIKKILSDVSAEWGMADAEIYVSKGAGYFPKVPWIGIMFKGEKPTDGVYPVMVFHKDGLIVACTESIVNPQAGFSSRCYAAEEIEKHMTYDGKAILPYVDEHMAKKSVTWLSYGNVETMTADKIKMPLCLAIKERQDYRKAHRIGERPWYRVVPMASVEKWMKKLSKGCEGWVFRGQGDKEWHLETGIGRSIYRSGGEEASFDDARIREAERDAIGTFYREIARKSEYKSFRNVELLALMQHYGTKTRLLDFSSSPLVALYFALESYDKYTGPIKTFRQTHKDEGSKLDVAEVKAISVWAVDIEQIDHPCWDEIDVIRKENGVGKNLGKSLRERLELFHDEAVAILNAEESKYIKPGIDVVIPSVNNDRSSAQEGLFLMPRRMDQSFESNLSIAVKQRNGDDGCCIRYDFPVATIEKIREYLKSHRVTAKQIYPDLTGLAKSLNAKVDFKGKE